MISRFFKRQRRLDSSDPEERLAALDGLSAEESEARQDQLQRMVLDDGDRRIREQALARLTDPKLLGELLARDSCREAAALHVAALAGAGQAGVLADHPQVLRARLRLDPSDTLLDAIVARGDESLLLDSVMVCPPDRRQRLLDLETFKQGRVLQELERRSRDHDKRLNRFARTGLEELRRYRSTAEQLVDRARERLDALDRSASVVADHEQRRRQGLISALKSDLEALAMSNEVLSLAGEPVTELAHLNLRMAQLATDVTGKTPTSAAQTSAPERPTATDPAEPFETLTPAFEALEKALAENPDFDALHQQRQELTTRWLEAADQAPPSEAQHRTFERASRRFGQLADAHERLATASLRSLETDPLPAPVSAAGPPDEKSRAGFESLRKDLAQARVQLGALGWPDWAPPAPGLTGLRAWIEEATARLSGWDEAMSTLERDTADRLQVLETHLEAGEIKLARAEIGAIRSAIGALPDARREALARQLGRVSTRLSELDDWQRFATSPKRESLCQAMAELAEHPQAPQEQAQRIKALRAQWNQLGPVTRAADRRFLDRFNDAAQTAFEPCREYFAQQADQRNRNLQGRIEICESLAAYLASTDWSKADYKAAETIMRAARQEWRNLHPVDRNAGKPVEARFETLQADLHDHIKTEWDRNLTVKGQIVAQAEALLASDADLTTKIDEAKALQSRWQTVGPTPRRPDQELWRSFRAICDQIFAQRDQAKQSADESIRLAEVQARELLEEFGNLLDDPAAELSQSSLRTYRQRFEALPELPVRLRRGLERSFDELMHSARRALREADLIRQKARLQKLMSMDAQVSELEQRHLQGEQIEFEPPDPLFAQRWQTLGDEDPGDALARLVIEAEIAAELDSGPEDRDLRLAIQVELMNSGRGRDGLSTDPDELAARWCAIGPKPAAADRLRERLLAAMEKLLAP